MKLLTTMLRYLGTLFALQAVFGMLVFLLSDYRWVATIVSITFLGLIFMAGRSFGEDLLGRAPVALAPIVGLVWQLPGLQGTVGSVSDMIGFTTYNGITDLMDFGMETWHTVLLPILAAIQSGQVDGYYARYYIALLALSPMLVLLFTLGATPVSANYLRGKRRIGK